MRYRQPQSTMSNGTQGEREKESKKEETHALTQTMSIKMAEMCRAECMWIY